MREKGSEVMYLRFPIQNEIVTQQQGAPTFTLVTILQCCTTCILTIHLTLVDVAFSISTLFACFRFYARKYASKDSHTAIRGFILLFLRFEIETNLTMSQMLFNTWCYNHNISTACYRY